MSYRMMVLRSFGRLLLSSEISLSELSDVAPPIALVGGVFLDCSESYQQETIL